NDANKIIKSLYKNLQSVDEAFVIAIPPPPVRGIGNSGGFKMQIMDQDSSSMTRVLDVARRMMVAANKTPGLSGVFTTFSESTPE
ncbi:efflux RND transporter permease subunit, partial [Rhizobium brockwellii]